MAKRDAPWIDAWKLLAVRIEQRAREVAARNIQFPTHARGLGEVFWTVRGVAKRVGMLNDVEHDALPFVVRVEHVIDVTGRDLVPAQITAVAVALHHAEARAV